MNQPSGGLLSGLSKNPNVSAFARGSQMARRADLGMGRAQKQQQVGVDQMQQDSQQRQQTAQNYASRAGNEAQERTAGRQLDNQRTVFDLGMKYNYAQANAQKQNSFQQALLNTVARGY